jgi:hypothetical protein
LVVVVALTWVVVVAGDVGVVNGRGKVCCWAVVVYGGKVRIVLVVVEEAGKVASVA